MKHFILSIFALSAFSITGGQKIKKGFYESTVLISTQKIEEIQQKGVFAIGHSFCVATAIHPLVIYTAAHCLEGNVYGVVVLQGHEIKLSEPETYNIRQGLFYDIHPTAIKNHEYKQSTEFLREMQQRGIHSDEEKIFTDKDNDHQDIAYIILDHPLELEQDDILPLMTEQEINLSLRPSKRYKAIGNKQNREDGEFTKHLRKLRNITIKNEKNPYTMTFTVGVQPGDSGGPIVAKENGTTKIMGTLNSSSDLSWWAVLYAGTSSLSQYTKASSGVKWLGKEIHYNPNQSISEGYENILCGLYESNQKVFLELLPIFIQKNNYYDASNLTCKSNLSVTQMICSAFKGQPDLMVAADYAVYAFDIFEDHTKLNCLNKTTFLSGMKQIIEKQFVDTDYYKAIKEMSMLEFIEGSRKSELGEISFLDYIQSRKENLNHKDALELAIQKQQQK